MALRLRSLRARLVSTTVVAAVLAVGMLTVGLQLLLARQTTAESAHVLRGRADAATATVVFRGGDARVLDPPADSLDRDIWVFDDSGRQADGRPPPAVLRGAVSRLAASRATSTHVVAGRYRVLARPVLVPGSQRVGAVVVAALDLRPYESSERRGLWLSLALGGVAVVAAAASAWAASGYALRQVRRMARRADDWREHDLTGRFALDPAGDELTELAQTLDRMLDRIGQALHAERRLTDEVAHELRTPLAVIRTEAQLALADGDGSDGQDVALGAIVEATERMERSIGTMLAVARSTHEEAGACLAHDVLSTAAEHAPGRDGVSVQVRPVGEGLRIAAPATVVCAALAPLVDNAVRHARSVVSLAVRAEPHRVLVRVEDDGAGVDPEHHDDVFRPGFTSADGGSGLGLALARRLASSIGAELRVEGTERGLFVLDLPRARAVQVPCRRGSPTWEND